MEKEYDVKNKIISIEDDMGNTLMALEIDEQGKIINMNNCEVADVDEDNIFNTEKELYRIQII